MKAPKAALGKLKMGGIGGGKGLRDRLMNSNILGDKLKNRIIEKNNEYEQKMRNEKNQQK